MSGAVLTGADARSRAALPDLTARAAPTVLLESKLRLPYGRVGLVHRPALIQELESAGDATPLVVLSAGPGWGKTTLLTQWAARSSRPFAWVSADENDNDPLVLLTYVAAAFDRACPIDPDVLDLLARPGITSASDVVARLGAALAGLKEPVVLVLDDLHLVDARVSLDAIAVLADHVPPGSQLVVSARGRPELPLAPWRARGLAVEIGPERLRMDPDEARFLLRAAGADLADTEAAQIAEDAEGWPAGLYLAALSVRERRRSTGVAAAVPGTDRLVADYLRAELLASLPEDEIRFLTRTAVLEEMSGPLCDAVLDTSGSAARLESLADSNLFVVSLDRGRGWYRYHHLFHELLRSELERRDQDAIPVLLRRAADWSVAHGDREAAVGYAEAAGDVGRVTSLVERFALPICQNGGAATAAHWLDWVERHDGGERNAAVAVLSSLLAAVQGRAAESDRWADAARRGARTEPLADGSESIEAWLAFLDALRCPAGVARMRDDAARAMRLLDSGSPFRPPAMVLGGLARWLTGDSDEADDVLADAAEEAAARPAPDAAVLALALRALIAAERGAWGDAEAFTDRATRLVRAARLGDYPATAVVCAVAARVALHRASAPSARRYVAAAERLRPRLTSALPHLAVLSRVELVRSHLLLADVSGAEVVMREIDSLVRRQPDLGRLVADVRDLRTSLSTVRADAPGAETLTTAELRVLPLLTTHLSFREIGDRLYLSRHTVKSHAMAVYRKLNVTSRDGAVERARELGLV